LESIIIGEEIMHGARSRWDITSSRPCNYGEGFVPFGGTIGSLLTLFTTYYKAYEGGSLVSIPPKDSRIPLELGPFAKRYSRLQLPLENIHYPYYPPHSRLRLPPITFVK
jgi:hypothetical protein